MPHGWPEQDATEHWWINHRNELNKAVSKERIRLQNKNEALEKALEPFAQFNSSEEEFEIKVKGEWVSQARAALLANRKNY